MGEGDPGVERVGTVARWRPSRRLVAFVAVTAVLVAGGATAAVAVADRVAHQRALDAAVAAHDTARRTAAAHRAAVTALEVAIADGLAYRNTVADQVLAHPEFLGGADALAPLAAGNAALGDLLEELVVPAGEPAERPVLRGVAAIAPPPAIDPDAGTDELASLAAELLTSAAITDGARAAVTGSRTDVEAAVAAVAARLADLIASVPSLWAELAAGYPLAAEEAQLAASAAADALGAARADAGAFALVDGYLAAASAVKTGHDAETARRAAEEAAQQARPRPRGGSTGGGGGSGGIAGTPQQGVLGETNAQRSANGLGSLSWNGTLASHACAFAGELAAANGGLYHSGSPGGFSSWGENVASGYGTASAVVAGWMASDGHRANILRPQFTVMAACSATSATGRVYWVQQFGG